VSDQPKVELYDWLVTAEIDRHIDVTEEDSVRDDWWRASCGVHDWYATGHRPIVEDAAAEHVTEEHRPCSAPGPFFDGETRMHCRLLPSHDGDHMTGAGHEWPKMRPRIQRCRPAVTGCHGRHGGPWMLFTDREDAFMPCATWDEALAKLASWYEGRR
jgi:hypothetical protein